MMITVCLSLIWTPSCTRTKELIAGVSGTVTFEGKPVKSGMVTFASDSGFAAAAPLKPDGTYVLKSHHGNGIPPGDYSVAVGPPEIGDPDADEVAVVVSDENAFPDIPARYRLLETTPLRFTVKKGANRFDIGLAL